MAKANRNRPNGRRKAKPKGREADCRIRGIGGLSASVWVNEDDEEGYPKFSVIVSKSYFDEESQEWVTLKSLSDRDMLELAYLAAKVREYCDGIRTEFANEASEDAA